MARKLKRPASGLRTTRTGSRPTNRPAGNARRVGGLKSSLNRTQARQRALRNQGLGKIADRSKRIRPRTKPAAAPRRIMPTRSAPANVSAVSANRNRRSPRGMAKPRPQTGRGNAVRVQPKSMPMAQTRAARARPKTRPQVQPRATGSQAKRAVAVGAAAAGAGLAAAAFSLNASRGHPEIMPELSALSFALDNLENLSSFDDISEDLIQLDRELVHTVELLESARDKGYVYEKELDDLAIQAASRWQEVYQPTLEAVEKKGQAFQSQLEPLGRQVPQLNSHLGSPTAAAPHLRATETTVNGLIRDVNTIRGNLRAEYSEVESDVYRLRSRLTQIHWGLSQLEEAKFSLEESENIVGVVKNRLDGEEKDDPEGILYLTSRRLIFERKEKVATKKVLFIATEKELVQEIVFAEPVSNLTSAKAQSKGLFGHQDFLETSFAGSLGTLSLHLDGQDSESWATLIQKVKTGKIEEERATPGALSMLDLSGELTQADLAAIQSEVNQIQDELMLADVRSELEEVENELGELERDLADVRARGYAVEKGLESDIAVLAAQWERVKTNAVKTLDMQAGLLAEKSGEIDALMSKLAGMSARLAGARPVYMQLKSAIASAEAHAAAAEDTVFGQFDDYAEEIEGVDAHLDWIDWMLDALSTASFQLLATESGVAAAEATYARPGMDPENGVLFLTDQRLIWEDRVGDYEIRVDVPVSLVENVQMEANEEGEESLDFTFGPESDLHGACFELSAPVGETWLQMVGRARGGEYAGDRAVEIDPAEIERIQNAPTQCSNCGAQFTTPLLRGQTEMTCEYCGVVTRV